MLDIKKLMRGFKIFNNATQADSVQLTVGDTYSGNYDFTFPNTGATSGQEIVTSGATQTLTNKNISLAGVTPNRLLRSDGSGAIVASNATYSDSASDVTLNITTARDFVINGKAVRVPTAAADPAGVNGDIYFNTVGEELRFYNSGGWQQIAASASANQTLSNLLSPTAINQDLLPSGAQDIGATGNRFDNIFATNTNTNTLVVNTSLTSATNLPFVATSILFDIDQASDPAGVAQKVYYNSVSNQFRYHNGTIWQNFVNDTDLTAKANTTLNNLGSTAVNVDILPQNPLSVNLGGQTNSYLATFSGRYAIVGSSNQIMGGMRSGATSTIPNGLGPANASIENVSDAVTSGDFYIFTTNVGSSTNSRSLYLLTGNTSTGLSGQLYLKTGSTSGTNTGAVFISSGDGNSGAVTTTGNVSITTGSTAINSGSITIQPGTSSGAAGFAGDITIGGGNNSDSTGSAGGVLIQAGQNGNGDRAAIDIYAGADVDSQSGGIHVTGRYLKIPVGTGNPALPTAGSMYFNTSTNQIRIWNGSAWRNVATT